MARRTEEHNLAAMYPDLAKQWHPTRNGDLRPDDVTPGSHKKVWWICSEGHEWQTWIFDRTRGYGCLACYKERMTAGHNLQVKNPQLAAEWHPSKNGELTPRDVTPFSNRVVWWRCKNGHEWTAPIHIRAMGTGCPYCNQRRLSEDNCLEELRPDLVKEWHAERNTKVTPRDVTPSSQTVVWWRCWRGHKYQARVSDKAKGSRCPYCAKRPRTTKEYNLEIQNPDLASQWHPKKNGKFTPCDVTPGSGMKVWWICDKGHEYQAVVANRTRGRGCPYCAGRVVSKDNCLAAVNPSLARQWHPEKSLVAVRKGSRMGGHHQ